MTSASPSGSKCFVGVFDGHGEKGQVISNFARNAITKSLFNHKELHTDPKTALEHAYDEAQRQIERSVGPDASYSGTTAVAAYRHRDRLLVANVGDSRAVLGCINSARGASGGGNSGGGMKAVELSSDHKPSRPDEKRRITEKGGIVQQSAIPVQTKGGGLRFMRMGPERVMDKGGMGGLAVSRSLGDLSLRPYVIAVPEVQERRLSNRDKLLILGSDGVWDHISSQEAVNIASKHSDPAQAARVITNIAQRRWHAETQGMLSDDITAVVVHLDNDDSPGSPAAGQGRPVARASSSGAVPHGHGQDRGDRFERDLSMPASHRRQDHTSTQRRVGGMGMTLGGGMDRGGDRAGAGLDMRNTLNGPLSRHQRGEPDAGGSRQAARGLTNLAQRRWADGGMHSDDITDNGDPSTMIGASQGRPGVRASSSGAVPYGHHGQDRADRFDRDHSLPASHRRPASTNDRQELASTQRRGGGMGMTMGGGMDRGGDRSERRTGGLDLRNTLTGPPSRHHHGEPDAESRGGNRQVVATGGLRESRSGPTAKTRR